VSSVVRKAIEESVKDIRKAFENAFDAVVTGLAMIADDIADFPKVDRLHHWIVGAVILAIGLVAILLILAMH